MAQVEPLPLVPATVITGQSKRRSRRWATSRTRSRPSAIFLGCRRSQYASHASNVGNEVCILRAIVTQGQCPYGVLAIRGLRQLQPIMTTSNTVRSEEHTSELQSPDHLV